MPSAVICMRCEKEECMDVYCTSCVDNIVREAFDDIWDDGYREGFKKGYIKGKKEGE